MFSTELLLLSFPFIGVFSLTQSYKVKFDEGSFTSVCTESSKEFVGRVGTQRALCVSVFVSVKVERSMRAGNQTLITEHSAQTRLH